LFLKNYEHAVQNVEGTLDNIQEVENL